MRNDESIRLGSIIRIWSNDRSKFEDAEVIGYVIGKKQQIRVRYLDDDHVELRDDITIDNTDLITY